MKKVGSALRVATRPVWGSGATRRRVVIETYRGYGCDGAAFVMGRVFRQPIFGLGSRRGTFVRDLGDLVRRFVRWGIAGARLRVSVAGAEAETVTDRRGYFHTVVESLRLPDGEGPWHDVRLYLKERSLESRGVIYAPPHRSRFVVVSDIDDTVMLTGVAHKLRMLWRLFFSDAESRVAFPGVASFYRALHGGPSGKDANAMLYVSRGPWGLHQIIERFFHAHRIPIGPVLFLRDWGFTLQHPLPRRSRAHKRDLILPMFEVYPKRRFVLLGDSGQEDPEIYSDIVRRHPGRVEVVYIRDVSRGESRREAILQLAEELRKASCDLVLARDSLEMARDAVARGLIRADALDEIARACVEDEGRSSEALPSGVRASRG